MRVRRKERFVMTSVFFGLVISYLLAGLLGIHAHTNPAEMDTVSYLETSYQIAQTGGVLAHIPNCLKGIYLESTRHPLYMLILSTFAMPNIDFFVNAKICTYFIGLLLLLTLFYVVYRRFGFWSAFIAAIFTSRPDISGYMGSDRSVCAAFSVIGKSPRL